MLSPSPAKNPSTDLSYLIPHTSHSLALAHLLVDVDTQVIGGGIWVEVEAQFRKYGKDMAHYYNDIINVILDKKQQWMCKASGRICAEQSALEVHRQ